MTHFIKIFIVMCHGPYGPEQTWTPQNYSPWDHSLGHIPHGSNSKSHVISWKQVIGYHVMIFHQTMQIQQIPVA